jgi:CHASE3 domain sensor protein
MTIRAKIYAAIVLTIIGPVATIGVALWGAGQMRDAFDSVQASQRRESLALQIKFAVTDMNGWQTAYGYDNGRSRPTFLRSVDVLERNLAAAGERLTSPRERELLTQLERQFAQFMALDERIFSNLRAGREEVVRRLILGPEIVIFLDMARTAQRLATLETRRSAQARADFDQAGDDARRGLVVVALGAALVIVLLLVTANDIVRLALEGHRRRDPA